MIKINHQFQDLHVPGSNVERWIELQQVERDICLLYHQLSEYSHIMGDLYYGSVFALRYWDFLEVDGIESDRKTFIRQGCLILILAMCWDTIDGSGDYLRPHLKEVSSALKACSPEYTDTRKLLGVVQLALELISEGREETPELVDLSNWVHRKFVRGYFRDTADDFDTNPYFLEDG